MHTLVIAQYESIMHNTTRVASINTIILCILEVTVHTHVRSSLIMTASWYCAILGIALGVSPDRLHDRVVLIVKILKIR